MSVLQIELTRRAYILIVEIENNRRYIPKQGYAPTKALNRAKKFNSIKAAKEFIDRFELINTSIRGVTTSICIDSYSSNKEEE